MEYLAIYPDWLEGLRHLSGDGVKAWLLTCVKAAENDGEGVEIDKAPEEIRGVLGFTISAIRAQAKKRRTLAENGRKGGRPKALKKPNESKRKQTKAQSNTNATQNNENQKEAMATTTQRSGVAVADDNHLFEVQDYLIDLGLTGDALGEVYLAYADSAAYNGIGRPIDDWKKYVKGIAQKMGYIPPRG